MDNLIKDTKQQLARLQTQRQKQADDLQSLQVVFDQNKQSFAITKIKLRTLKERLQQVSVSTNALIDSYLAGELPVSQPEPVSVKHVHFESPHFK